MQSEQDRVKEVIVESRIAKVLSLRTDSIVMLEALDAISDIYTSNDVESRKSLRRNLELQNVELGKKFLNEMVVLKNRLDAAEALSNHLHDTCTILARRVEEADQNMKSFVDKAGQLETDRSHLLHQSQEIRDFISQFHLSQDEVTLLSCAKLDESSQVKAFFHVLSKVKRAYKECQALAQNQGYSVGFELLEILGRHQDSAYLLLYNWVKAKCDYLSETGVIEDLEVNSRLQMAIVYLKEVPLYYTQCQDLLVQARRSQLLQRFMLVLTQGESGSSNKYNRALDLLAHDAVSYVGGMLAFVHQLLAAEREFVDVIFGNNAGDVNKDKNGVANEELLARSVAALGKPLRIRIMQTLEHRCQIDTFYSIADLLTFYLQTVDKVIRVDNALHSAIAGCLVECKKMFVKAVTAQGEALKTSPIACPIDLKVATTAKDYIYQISSLLKIYHAALSEALGKEEDNCLFIDAVLGDLISQILQSCRLGSQGLQSAEMATYMLNNITAIQHEVAEASVSGRDLHHSHSPAKTAWEGLLVSEAQSWIDILVAEEVQRFLRRSDMDKLVELVEVLPRDLCASEQIGLSADRVATILRAFYSSLFSSLPAQYEKLQDPAVREQIRSVVADRIVHCYGRIHAIVSDPSNRYETSGLLGHSVDEVRVLLGGITD